MPEDIKVLAADLPRDSDELEAFSRANVSWESQAAELEAIKERINKIGQTIQKQQNLAAALPRGSRKPSIGSFPLHKSSPRTLLLRLNISTKAQSGCKIQIQAVLDVQCGSRACQHGERLCGLRKDKKQPGQVGEAPRSVSLAPLIRSNNVNVAS